MSGVMVSFAASSDEVASDCAAVADLRRADFPRSTRQWISALANQFGHHAIIVCNERPKVDHIIFVNCDLVKIGNARNIYESIYPLTDAAFEFENEIGTTGNNAGALFLFPKILTTSSVDVALI